ncbi:MAG: hypothetical protein IPK64_14835 [bacterium]|nr:hypothetical protein [bacterium]
MNKTLQKLAPRGGAVPGLLMSLALALALAGGRVEAAPSVAEDVARALTLNAELEFDRALALARPLLERKDLTDADRIAVYSALSTIHYSMGKKHHAEAFSFLEKIRELGPCLIDLPAEFWNKSLREQWYRTLQAKQQLTCVETEAGLRTVAIMEFDNYSTGKYQDELGFVAKGLSDFFESDFRQLDGLQVVERDKLEFVLKEIMLTKEGLVDEATAVRAGKLLGAQIMIFGSIMQLDAKNARMLVKAVKVETSEILATAERGGKPEFFGMQKELVSELAKKLEIVINPQAEQRLDASGPANADAGTLYSRGLDALDRYEYADAYEFFKRAWELDQTFAEAKAKMDIYRPLALSS